MDPFRFTTLAHATHDFCNPVGAATLDRQVASLDLPPGSRVLDVGCGKGELLIRIVARWRARGVGVDVNAAFLDEARTRAAGRVPEGSIEWIEMPMSEAPLPAGGFDLAICIGSAHALGDLPQALDALGRLARPGGRILLGHGYWEREPEAEYLAAFGGTRDELRRHDENLATARAAGFEVLGCALSSPAEWDEYEARYARNIEDFCAAHPDDPDREALLARSRSWRAAYEKWGRGTMGFALYDLSRRSG